MKTLITLALVGGLIGCSPLRHYQKVALDPFRNSAERSLLSRACTQEFPAIQDTGRVIKVGVDSSDYNAVAEAYNVLLDSLIAMYERDTVSYPGVIRICTPGDSARIIRNFLRIYKPPAVIKTEIKEVKVTDMAAIAMKQSEVDKCREENAALATTAKNATEKLKDKNQTNVWLWVVLGLLAAGNVYQLFKR